MWYLVSVIGDGGVGLFLKVGSDQSVLDLLPDVQVTGAFLFLVLVGTGSGQPEER